MSCVFRLADSLEIIPFEVDERDRNASFKFDATKRGWCHARRFRQPRTKILQKVMGKVRFFMGCKCSAGGTYNFVMWQEHHCGYRTLSQLRMLIREKYKRDFFEPMDILNFDSSSFIRWNFVRWLEIIAKAIFYFCPKEYWYCRVAIGYCKRITSNSVLLNCLCYYDSG